MIEPKDLDAAWFQGVLAGRYPGVRVAAAEVTRVQEMTNAHVLVSLSYAEADGAPESVFVKLPSTDPRRRQLLGGAAMGRREARFYERLGPVLDLRAPQSHGVILEDDGGFAMVLEDLNDSGCVPHDGLTGVEPDAAADALADLAAMHVRYEDPAARTGDDVAWLKATDRPKVDPAAPDLLARMLRRGIDAHRGRISDAYAAVGERLISDRAAVWELWDDAPATVVHGDLHLGNLFSDHGRVGFLDWGLMALADPLRDASYFLCLALDTDVRRAREVDLLRHYLDVRRGLGGRDIGWNDAWERHRIWSAYTVPASAQAIRVPADAPPRVHAFADAFLGRANAAVEDLEAPAAIGALT